jgi:uncharacterized protein YjbI with pentapeptide repeats
MSDIEISADADFSNTVVEDSIFQRTRFGDGTKFHAARLLRVDFTGARLESAQFTSGCRLH